MSLFCDSMSANANEAPYVVGILSPSTTLYIDHAPPLPSPDNGNGPVSRPPTLHTRPPGNSFQITSVTVQGSRGKADEAADDSCDDLDTDDLSSDLLDSASCNTEEELSPAGGGPVVFDRNMNMSVGVTPTFAAVGPVAAGGVTVMTSKSESPLSAQVPVMNPLPSHWQRRFKVVKIVSSEPFRKGRWHCMDFKDPPTEVGKQYEATPLTPPTIHITSHECGDHHEHEANGNFAQVYELPVNQTFSGNFVVANQQHMYGILLPNTDYVQQPVTLVQDLSLQTAVLDRNFNNNCVLQRNLMDAKGGTPNVSPPMTMIFNEVPHDQSPPLTMLGHHRGVNQSPPRSLILNEVRQSPPRTNINGVVNPSPPRTVVNNAVNQSPPRTMVVQNGVNQSPPSTQQVNHYVNHVNAAGGYNHIDAARMRNNSGSNQINNHPGINTSSAQPEESESSAPTGTNTVAIDNKIEQAMDLVKSHLMFAVREEVEVLKEKITELLERITQLEHENDILRANASPETLKQLHSHKKNLPPST